MENGGNPAVSAAPHCQKSQRRSRVRAISSGSAAPPPRDLHVHALNVLHHCRAQVLRHRPHQGSPLSTHVSGSPLRLTGRTSRLKRFNGSTRNRAPCVAPYVAPYALVRAVRASQRRACQSAPCVPVSGFHGFLGFPHHSESVSSDASC